MEHLWTYVIILLITLIFITILTKFLNKSPSSIKLPPGPPKLPFIGNLHQLFSRTTLPHRRLASLASIYGPLMHLQLGEVPTVVASSPSIAREVMKTHDATLCSRPRIMLAEVLYYGCTDIALAPYGEYWRQVRKIATLELFTMSRIQSFRGVMEEEVMVLVESLVGEAGCQVNLSQKLFSLGFNIILRIAINKKGKDGVAFKELLAEMTEIASGLSVVDLYPSNKLLPIITGFKRKLQDVVKRADKLLNPVIEEHISHNRSHQDHNVVDLVDILLTYHKIESTSDFSLTVDNIKSITLELFAGGSDTSSTVIEWAISEMLKNPRVMKKAQDEVRRVLQGKDMDDETILDKLKYLKHVIKETLRLHPPLPLLAPREAMEGCKIDGYYIPPKTRVFINVWAIGRDPKYWKDPEEFYPERFDDSLVDYKGNHFELTPFGAGRRMCPGFRLGTTTIELILAKLLYHFDWVLPDGVTPLGLDMTETFGLVGKRKNDLYVVPIPYTHPLSS